MMPLMATFSRPLISGWKPAPSSISAETRPFTLQLAARGLRDARGQLEQGGLAGAVLADHAEGASPRGTSKETPSRAVNVWSGRRSESRLPLRSALFSVLNWFWWRKRR